MSRDITSAAKAASQAEKVTSVIMASLDFSSGAVNVNSGITTITYNGADYLGIGQFGSISATDEGLELQSNSINLSVTGVDPAYISLALNEHYQGRTAVLYFGLLDDDHVLIADPVVLFRGRMDNMEISLGNQGTIQIKCTNPMADWERPRSRRYNNEDQQLAYPGDKGLEFVSQAADKQIYWGTNKPIGG